MGDDVAVGRKPGTARSTVAHGLFEDPDARTRGDDVRMKRKLEQAVHRTGGIQLTAEDVEHVGGSEMGRADPK